MLIKLLEASRCYGLKEIKHLEFFLRCAAVANRQKRFTMLNVVGSMTKPQYRGNRYLIQRLGGVLDKGRLPANATRLIEPCGFTTKEHAGAIRVTLYKLTPEGRALASILEQINDRHSQETTAPAAQQGVDGPGDGRYSRTACEV